MLRPVTSYLFHPINDGTNAEIMQAIFEDNVLATSQRRGIDPPSYSLICLGGECLVIVDYRNNADHEAFVEAANETFGVVDPLARKNTEGWGMNPRSSVTVRLKPRHSERFLIDFDLHRAEINLDQALLATRQEMNFEIYSRCEITATNRQLDITVCLGADGYFDVAEHLRDLAFSTLGLSNASTEHWYIFGPILSDAR